MIRRFGSSNVFAIIFSRFEETLFPLLFVSFRLLLLPRVVTVSGGIYEPRRIAMTFVEIAGTSSFVKFLRGLVRSRRPRNDPADNRDKR